MNRIALAALALACVCSPAMAAAAPPFEPVRAIQTTLFVMTFGAWGLALVLCVVRRQPIPAIMAAVMVAALVIGFGSNPASAQTAATVAQPAKDTAVVTVPLGTWLASYAAGIQEIVVSLVMGLIAFACRRLPAAAGSVIKGILTQQLVERAIAFGFNTVQGAADGMKLSVDVRSTVLANALNYAVQHAPEWFIKWVGGTSAIRDHIIALLPQDPDASLAHVTPTAVGPTTADPVRSLG